MAARVRGHALVAEGVGFVFTDRVTDHTDGRPARTRSTGVGGGGRAMCTCGDYSPILDSVTQRRAWHRDHKAAVTTDG